MLKRTIKRKIFLIGFSSMYIFSSSVSVSAGNTNASIDNVNQAMEVVDESENPEKQQLFDIITNTTLTDEEKADTANKLLYEGKNNIEEVETLPPDKSQFGGVNTGVIDSPLPPESERVKDIILAPNFTTDQKIDALNRLLYLGKEETGINEIATLASVPEMSLDIKIYKQATPYYCVPACVYSTMKYLTGSSYSQAFIASQLGTTPNGTVFSHSQFYLNNYQHNYYYIAANPGSLTIEKTHWFNTIYNSNAPVLFVGTLQILSNWEYEANSHCMMLIGVSADNRRYRIGDPYRKWANPDSPSNKYKRYAKRIHNAIQLNGNGYLY